MFYSINTNPFPFEPATTDGFGDHTRILYADARGQVNDETFAEPMSTQGEKSAFANLLILANPRCKDVLVQNIHAHKDIHIGVIGAKNVFMENCICQGLSTDATEIVSARNSWLREINTPYNVTTLVADLQRPIELYTPSITELNIRNTDLRDIKAPKLEILNIMGDSNVIAHENNAQSFSDIIISPDMPFGVVGYNLNTHKIVSKNGAFPLDSFIYDILRPRNVDSQITAQNFMHEAKKIAALRAAGEKKAEAYAPAF